jgi:hypothetical protein
MSRIRTASLAALLALAAGCTSPHPHENLGTAIDEAAARAAIALPPSLAQGAARLPAIAVAVSLPRAAPAGVRAAADAVRPAAGEAGGDEGKGRAAEELLPFDARVLGRELVATLAATGAFLDVIPVADGREVPDLALAEDEARGKGASFLVEATFEAPRLRRIERAFVLPIVVWAATGFPSLWIHNHVYRLDADVRLRLHDLNTGKTLPERPLSPAAAEQALNFHERTSSIWTYLLVNVFPSPFCPVDEDKVARGLAPAALEKPVPQFLERIGEALKGEVYHFELQAKEGGPEIEVSYPPADGKPVYLLERTVRYAAAARAPEGATIREVRVNGKLVFPARSRPGTLARRRVPIELTASLAEAESLLIQAWDSRGGESRRLIAAVKNAR